MTQIGAPALDAVPIGDIAAPPFARLPDPHALFAARADRFTALADGHDMRPYLLFMAGLARAQRDALEGLPAPAAPPARRPGRPALDGARLPDDPACDAAVDRFLARAAGVEMPAAARRALEAVVACETPLRRDMARRVLDRSTPDHALAEHILIAAGVQVHAARAAAALDVSSLEAIGDGVCPACGGPPVASVIVGWHGAHGARFCVCSLCATLWNYVRIRCVACGSTKGIFYKGFDGDDAVRAECCGECGSYLKILAQQKFPALDPVADDVATVALDMLLPRDDWRRAGFNPFLIGY